MPLKKLTKEFKLFFSQEHFTVASIVCIDQTVDSPLELFFELLSLVCADLAEDVTCPLCFVNQNIFQGHTLVFAEPESHIEPLGSQLLVAMLSMPLNNVDLISLVLVYFQLERVDSGLLKPIVCPYFEVIYRLLTVRLLMLLDCLVQAVYKVFQPRILELKALKVLAKALLDDFSAQESIHCLDPTCPFLVRYLVKRIFCVTCIVDIDLNGVGCRSQICIKTCTRKVEKQKFRVKVALLKACSLAHTRDRAEVGEALLEPEIIPPVHGREVSKPHMCQFVQMNVIVLPAHNIGPLICWNKNPIGESDSTDVLHG